MLGVPSGLVTSNTPGGGAVEMTAPPPPVPPQEAPESGGSSEGGGGGGGDVAVGGEEGERNSGGNRWPRQETLSLLKIRSDMDVVFKDSSLKGPLWEEVSRKMAELGYHRSAKKCKEKFENVYKYHRRTKEGRASKADGKTYRFFDQLQALENNPASLSLPSPPLAATPITMAMPMTMRSGSTSAPTPQNNASSIQNHPFVVPQNNVVTAATPVVNHPTTTPALPLSQPQPQPQPQPQLQPVVLQPMANLNQINRPQGNTTTSFLSNSTSSSSTSSDEDIQRRHMKKRKWKDFFEKLMKDVIEKQEELQKKFMETLEKRERDRMVREETWRVQEMARLNREHDLLVQERSMAAAKDATIIAFLQKITEQKNTPIPNSTTNTSPAQIQSKLSEQPSGAPPHSQPPQPQPPPPPPPPAVTVSLPMTIHTAVATPQALSLPMVAKSFEAPRTHNGSENFSPVSSSRWPKEEIEALISLRTCLDLKYQENGPKGPLWEEISAGMRKLGYNRNAKRCKEKWENINKYFKKVKESNKKRPEDSKTCPYFNQLEALYKEKAKNEFQIVQNTAGFGLRPENTTTSMAPIMAQPEQQWPLPQKQSQLQHRDQQGITNNSNQAHHDNHESDSMDQNEDDDDMEEDDDEDGYEIVTNKQPSSVAAATVTTTVATATAV